jgi:hypothetical protein
MVLHILQLQILLNLLNKQRPLEDRLHRLSNIFSDQILDYLLSMVYGGISKLSFIHLVLYPHVQTSLLSRYLYPGRGELALL